MKNNKTDMIGCAAAVFAAIILTILFPMLYYFGGWLTGVILEWTIGNTVIDGMNYLFNTERFTVDMLPRICGTLGVIGSFFKTTNTSTSSKK